MTVSRMRAALIALLLALGVAACGGGDGERAETSQTEHNDADVAFATDLLRHHADTLVLLDETLGADLDPEVAALVEDVRTSHATRSEALVDLLRAWDEEIPETSRDHVNAEHGHGDHGHGGAVDRAALLTDLADQHEAGLGLAEEEVTDGRYADAVELAEQAQPELESELEQIESLSGD